MVRRELKGEETKRDGTELRHRLATGHGPRTAPWLSHTSAHIPNHTCRKQLWLAWHQRWGRSISIL